MTEKILFVDDEPNVLSGIRRGLRGRFEIETATSGEEGLCKIRESRLFPVVVSDMKMPGMNGAQFLAQVRIQSPDSVRMILSGQAELESTISAVNDGHIFRFLTKPCPTETLITGLRVAIDQYRLIVAERQLLEETLSGAIQVLTEILGLVNPEAFSRASRVQQYAEGIAENLELPDRWQIRIAALLSQIGCVTLPADTLAKLDADQPLSDNEEQMFEAHPELAGKLLASIPRLETVSRMVAGQSRPVDTADLSANPQEWDPEVRGAQILRAAIEFDRLLTRGTPHNDALDQLLRNGTQLPEVIVQSLQKVRQVQRQMEKRALRVSELTASMILDQDVTTKTGIRVLNRGQEVTQTMQARLRNFADGVGIVEPIRVLVHR